MNNHSIFAWPASTGIGYMDHVVIFTNTASKSILPLLSLLFFVRFNLAFHSTNNKKPHQV